MPVYFEVKQRRYKVTTPTLYARRVPANDEMKSSYPAELNDKEDTILTHEYDSPEIARFPWNRPLRVLAPEVTINGSHYRLIWRTD
jgi:hypothetical protein